MGDLVRSVERASYRSWKAHECVEYDGWQLRYSDGFSRRGNSVNAAAASTRPFAEKLEHCRRWYAQRNHPLLFRLTPVVEPGLDEILDGVGFAAEGQTDVMTGEVGSRSGALDIEDAASRDWWETTSSLWGFDQKTRQGWQRLIAGLDLPAGFVCVPGEAAGLGIVDGPWIGLFEIVVAPGSRRQGLGTAVAESLLHWGGARGAERAYLQVVSENHPATALYRTLGFGRTYGYWYRRDQAEAESGT